MAASILGDVVSSGIRPTRRPRFKIFEMLVAIAPARSAPSGSISRSSPTSSIRISASFSTASWSSRRTACSCRTRSTRSSRQRGRRRGRRGSGGSARRDDGIQPGASCPIYEKTGTLTTKMQRALVHQALAQLPEQLPDPLPAAVRERRALIDRRRALREVHFPPEGTNLDELNSFRSPAHRRLIFEEFFLFQVGLVLRRPQGGQRAQATAGRHHRRDPRIGAARAAVQADRRSEEGDRGDRRRHEAAAADEPAAAGRRRLGQDDRGADGGAGRDGERAAGGVHGADRDPGRAALHQHHAGCSSARGSGSRCSPAPRRRRSAASCWPSSPAARSIWSSARTRWSRSPSRSASSGWSSSTSSTASACCSARRCARRDCTPTCW